MQVILDEVGHHFPNGPWLFTGLNRILIPGQIYALTGPSGSGKSTLLSLLAGWEKPSAGQILLDEVEKTGWVFQNPYGVARRSVLDHVMIPLLAQGNTVEEAQTTANELLETFHLSNVAGQTFMSLSGGEGQRLMLARGIASQPDLFLVDEPTAQLDLGTRREVNQVIQSLATDQTIVVVATHDEETRNACSEVIDLKHSQPQDYLVKVEDVAPVRRKFRKIKKKRKHSSSDEAGSL